MTEPTRKLAAIVFTDIVGFTQLTADDQQKASDLLDFQRNELKPLVETFGGKWVKEMGDGLILTFDTITNAVQCCLKIQGKAKAIENLSLRIGIHLGEILEKENDIIGDDVNVAARIEPFSAPGGIAISNKVHDAIIREEGFETKYLGKPKLKGVGQEVKVYCITSHGLPETILSDVSAKLESDGFKWNFYSLSGAALTAMGILFWINISFIGIGVANESDVPSIAIIPLDNKGAEADDFYAYGISSDLISDVASAGLIRVASLSDIEKLDYTNIDNIELSKKLFVRYITTGTIWKRDSIFQLSMELYDTKTEKVLWSERWQKNWNELPLIRHELAENILEKLKVDYNTNNPSYITIPEAYEYYLKAKNILNRGKADQIIIAEGLVKKAIELDENFILAKHILGDLYLHKNLEKSLDIYTESLKISETLKDKLLIGRTIRKIGIVYSKKGEDDKCIDHYKKSYEIAKEVGDREGMGQSLHNLGIFIKKIGKKEEALTYFEKSLAIREEIDDKFGIGYGLRQIAGIYQENDKNKKALDLLQRSLKSYKQINHKPGEGWVYIEIGNLLYTMGDIDKAIYYYEPSIEIFESLGVNWGLAAGLLNLWIMHQEKGDGENALKYYKLLISISQKIDKNLFIKNYYFSLGYMFCIREDYEKAADYLEKFIKRNEQEGDALEKDLINTSLLYLSYKGLGKTYNEKVIKTLLQESIDKDLDSYLNFVLYKLLEDKSYLEKAYNQIQEKVDAMEDEIKEKFLTYPIPKQIIQEWEGVS